MNSPARNASPPSPEHGLPPAPPAWQRLMAAAREARSEAPRRDDSAPYGFSTRVVALWRQAQEEERRLALWQRLSWRGAFASLTLCALVVVAQRGSGAQHGDQLLLEPPTIVFPGL